MALTSGTQLGPYGIASQLGSGGMGVVYKATDTRLDRTVAIKVLPEHVAQDPDLKQRFEREAKTVAALSHPHICPVFDVGEQDGINFLVMEYLEGETLAQRLEKGALPLDQALQVAIEIADALDKAHRQGIVHRDLKPGNIMLTRAGAKLLDFGLAREFLAPEGSINTRAETLQAITEEGTLVGTVPYMAPEQLRGAGVNARSDLWALGCILYEMATGDRPFQGASQADLIASIMAAQPDPPTHKQPLAPERLDRVVGRCLEKDPARRVQSAREVGGELDALGRELGADSLLDAPSVSRPIEPVGDSKETPKAWRWLVATGLVIAIGAITWNLMPTGSDGLTVTAERQTIAVLPFRDLSPGSELRWLADGISSDVRLQLGLGDLFRVLPGAATAGYESSAGALSTLVDETGVDFVLDGYTQGTMGQARVVVELIEASSSEQVWTQEFSAQEDDPLDLQRRASAQIQRYLGSAVPGAWWPSNPEARVPFLKYLQHQWGGDPNLEFQWLERTLEVDPTFAAGHAWQAMLYGARVSEQYDERWVGESRRALDRAREAGGIDNPDYKMAEARHLWSYEGDTARAEELLAEVATAQGTGWTFQYGQLMWASGLVDEALNLFELLNETYPDQVAAWGATAAILASQGDFEGALQAVTRAEESTPPDSYAGYALTRAWALPRWGRLEEARELQARVAQLGRAAWLSVVSFELAMAEGDREGAIRVLEQAEERGGYYTWIGAGYLRLGHVRADELLERAIQPPFFDRRDLHAIVGMIPPEQRDDSRLQRVVTEMGFTPEWRLEMCRRAATLPPETGIGCDPSKYALDTP